MTSLFVKCPSCSKFIKMTNSVNDPSSTIKRHCSHPSGLKKCDFNSRLQNYEIVNSSSRAFSNQGDRKRQKRIVEILGNIQPINHCDKEDIDDDNDEDINDDNNQDINDDNDEDINEDNNHDNNDYNEEFEQRPQELSQIQYNLIVSQIIQQVRPSPLLKRFDTKEIVYWIWAFYRNQLPSKLPFFGWYEFQQKVLIENDPVHQKLSFNKQQGSDVSSLTVALIFSTANKLGTNKNKQNYEIVEGTKRAFSTQRPPRRKSNILLSFTKPFYETRVV